MLWNIITYTDLAWPIRQVFFFNWSLKSDLPLCSLVQKNSSKYIHNATHEWHHQWYRSANCIYWMMICSLLFGLLSWCWISKQRKWEESAKKITLLWLNCTHIRTHNKKRSYIYIHDEIHFSYFFLLTFFVEKESLCRSCVLFFCGGESISKW